MPTNKSTKVSQELQEDLAAFGILRRQVMENAAPKQNGAPNFFGIKDKGNEVELKFDTDISAIQDSGMMVALAAPENETFNMLVTTNFKKAISTGSQKDLRAFLRRIVDKV